MKVYFITDTAIEVLKEQKNREVLLPLFREETNGALLERLKSMMGGDAFLCATQYEICDDLDERLVAAKNVAECVELVYNELKDLPPTIACDERFWVGLAIYSCWKFVQKRKEDRGSKKIEALDRYVFASDSRRGIMRHVLARLWWIGYLTYDSTREDPYKLTKLVCEKADYVASVFERSFSNSFVIVQALIEAIEEYRKESGKEILREWVRPLCKYVNMLGGIYILETLPVEKLKEKIKTKAREDK